MTSSSSPKARSSSLPNCWETLPYPKAENRPASSIFGAPIFTYCTMSLWSLSLNGSVYQRYWVELWNRRSAGSDIPGVRKRRRIPTIGSHLFLLMGPCLLSELDGGSLSLYQRKPGRRKTIYAKRKRVRRYLQKSKKSKIFPASCGTNTGDVLL